VCLLFFSCFFYISELILDSSSQSSPKASAVTSNNPNSNKPTPTTKAAGNSLDQPVVCDDADACISETKRYLEDQGYNPCDDISKSCGDSDDCFDSSRGGATSKCKSAADYKIKLTDSTAKKKQKITVFSSKVAILITILRRNSDRWKTKNNRDTLWPRLISIPMLYQQVQLYTSNGDLLPMKSQVDLADQEDSSSVSVQQ